MKLAKVCGYSNHTNCGFNSKIKTTQKLQFESSRSINLPTKLSNLLIYPNWDTTYENGYSFTTLNGYSMMLFYNPKCGINNFKDVNKSSVCIDIVWDINGEKGPNAVSKDVGFTTVFFQNSPVTVTPIAATSNASNGTFYKLGEICNNYGKGYRPPNKYEFSSMAFNGYLIGINDGWWWTSSVYNNKNAYAYLSSSGTSGIQNKNYSLPIRCIKS
jgi:hypothetical protein